MLEDDLIVRNVHNWLKTFKLMREFRKVFDCKTNTLKSMAFQCSRKSVGKYNERNGSIHISIYVNVFSSILHIYGTGYKKNYKRWYE